MENQVKVTCPNCKHEFNIEIEQVLAANIEKKHNAEFAEKLKAEAEKIKNIANSHAEAKLKEYNSAIEKKNEELKKLQNTELEKNKLEKQIKDINEQAELELAKKLEAKLQEREIEIKAAAEKMANDKATLKLNENERQLKAKAEQMDLTIAQKSQEAVNLVRAEEQMKNAELQKQLDVQKKLAEEMQRKAEQGSMQLQGEVQELAIEDWLKKNFPLDEIEEIKKGARGADCAQKVNTYNQKNCGTIYYESKRTKDFQPAWIEKFKTDMREKGASFGVLVTDVMPKDMDRLGKKDGIWICSFEEFKGLCFVLRDAVIMLGEAQQSGENKGEKMALLYDFLSGSEFRSNVEAIVEGFVQMKEDLESEKRALMGAWKKREKQIEKVVLNTNNMYNSIRGIAGNTILSIKALELPDSTEESNNS